MTQQVRPDVSGLGWPATDAPDGVVRNLGWPADADVSRETSNDAASLSTAAEADTGAPEARTVGSEVEVTPGRAGTGTEVPVPDPTATSVNATPGQPAVGNGSAPAHKPVQGLLGQQTTQITSGVTRTGSAGLRTHTPRDTGQLVASTAIRAERAGNPVGSPGDSADWRGGSGASSGGSAGESAEAPEPPELSPLTRPAHTRIVTVANQKGGVGKTTTVVNLGAALSQAGMRVVVIDADPQGNASTALGVPHHSEVPSVYDVLVNEASIEEVSQPCPLLPGLLCVPATIELAGAEIELVSFVAREMRLKRAINAYLDDDTRRGSDRPDYILIDCPPSLGLLTINAFVAGQEVLIPIQCEYYALEGLSMLLKNIDMIRRHLNPDLHVSTILLTMFDARTRLSAEVAEEVRAHFPAQVLNAVVPRSVRVSEAPSHGQTVISYDVGSVGARSYIRAAEEVMAMAKTSGSVAGRAPQDPGGNG